MSAHCWQCFLDRKGFHMWHHKFSRELDLVKILQKHCIVKILRMLASFDPVALAICFEDLCSRRPFYVANGLSCLYNSWCSWWLNRGMLGFHERKCVCKISRFCDGRISRFDLILQHARTLHNDGTSEATLGRNWATWRQVFFLRKTNRLPYAQPGGPLLPTIPEGFSHPWEPYLSVCDGGVHYFETLQWQCFSAMT